MTDENLLQSPPDNQGLDENKDWFAEYTKEGGKFYDPDPEIAKRKIALAKAKSDNYVKILESRIDAAREDILKLREENVAGRVLQDRIDELKRLEQQQLTSREQPPKSNEGLKPELDLTKLDELVDSKIQLKVKADIEAKNYSDVKSKLKERFGDNYANVLKDKAELLGLSDTDINQMARINPNLFYKTFDVDTNRSDQFQAPPASRTRVDTFAPKTAPKRTMSYYLDLKKKDPLAWYNKDTAVQMDKDSQELGEAFYDV